MNSLQILILKQNCKNVQFYFLRCSESELQLAKCYHQLHHTFKISKYCYLFYQIINLVWRINFAQLSNFRLSGLQIQNKMR
ncbi:unnamed protein product [Paramecium octaurelia]|uniref:Uncharacterized protein n=1 Tax=Paramecium octaurelia TaxID=43137 RepID=A0A8S1XC99_PAROT|nr:unnamed protein product [Paramecium octaurelia]